MQIRHLKSIVSAAEEISRISSITWSPNGQKLAICGADKIIQLYDETGERKDRFATKPADPSKTQKYTVTGMAFSPDSTKLAIAQSDGAVFVYKLGLEWGEKKSICNKFIQTVDITCLTWPKEQHNAIVFGLADGKVRIGNLKTNKAATLYQTESQVISTTSSMDGNAIVTGHLDGTINRFFFDDGASGATQGKFCTHSCPPYALAWGECVVVAGSDRQIVFYDQEGHVMQEFDYSKDDEEHEFTVAEFSPSGQSVVIGSFNRFRVFDFNITHGGWVEAPMKVIDNFYTVTNLSWKPDGSRLVAGNATGAIELFDCCLRRSRYNGKFEFNYVSPSQVIVKRFSTGSRIVLKSHYGYEILKINIFQDQYLIAHTPETLLLGDLALCKLSEIPWTGVGNEKYYFENPQICMIFNAGELTLVEYGVNDVLGSCRTEHMNPHLISVRVNERKATVDCKRIAYLVDLQTMHILDLNKNLNLAIITHDSKIDWLELSGKGTKLLFRDRRRQLHLFDIFTQTRTTLLHFCCYVQWVPGSDVVVAQSRNNLCIWYSIDSPERMTMFPIKGEIENIERHDGKTEVIVDEGVNSASYALDEGLIEFGAAVDDLDFERAITLLETLELTPETEAMWRTLSNMAIKESKLAIAQRCFAALGDVAKVRYLENLSDLTGVMKDQSLINTKEDYVVRARLAALDKNFKLAENIFLEQGHVEEAMALYQELHKWNSSIKVAEMKGHPELENLRRNYFQWLVDSNQEPQAGEMKEEEGDYVGAINLYLQGGMPARAAYLLLHHHLATNIDLTERIASSLLQSGLYEKAGNLYEKLGSQDRALDAYKRGNAFRAAVELCRSFFPREVVSMEEQWGDHLVSQKQYDAAVNHYIEAGKSLKAVEAAITARQWKKAVSIVESMNLLDVDKQYFLRLATHFAEIADFPAAEKYYVSAGKTQEAIDMYTKAGQWEKAHNLASSFMSVEEVTLLYISQAKEMEQNGKLKDAEKLFLTVGEPDLAINMYKSHKLYDHMIRLVSSYHKDLLVETHLFLARTLESEGNLKSAEHHFLEAKDWKSAINMYCANNMYEEAYRAGKAAGGASVAKQVAYLWARSLGGEASVKLLSKFGLLDAAIEFACESSAFDFAFELCKFMGDKQKATEVHLKYGMFLEDENKHKEAEEEFKLAGRPKEAILMYAHLENWEEALRIAEEYDPSSVGDVLAEQGKKAFQAANYSKAESLLLRAQKPEIVIVLYKEALMWKEALRFAKEYIPSKVAELNSEFENLAIKKAGSGKDDILGAAKAFEQQKDYSRAIDLYLRLNTTHTSDLKALEHAWERSVELSLKFVPDRAMDVVGAACAKLIEIKRFDQAAELYLGVEMYKECIDAYISAAQWQRAKEILEIAPKYKEYIESQYLNYLKTKGDAEGLVNVDASAGLEMLAKQGDWEKCLQAALLQGPDALQKYLGTYAVQLIKERKFLDAAEAFNRYSVPCTSQFFDIYTRLSKEILHDLKPESVSALREVLFKLVSGVNIPRQFNEYLIIAHIATLKSYCARKKELVTIAAKQSIALLRYTTDIICDQAFYEAGLAAKTAGMLNMTFVCWNRFLDLCDAIEEGSLAMIENSDFEGSDVPYDVQLPNDLFSETKREEARDWVLQISLDQKVKQEVDSRNCEQCHASVYEASLICSNCNAKEEPCIVTGYPLQHSRVKCSSCDKSANKDDWNKFVMSEKMCPWCASSQTPNYSLR